jgi:hypothetical protein
MLVSARALRPAFAWPGGVGCPLERGTVDAFMPVGRQGQASEPTTPARVHAAVDLIADATHDLDGLAGRVLELPVLIALARMDRTGVTAAHR